MVWDLGGGKNRHWGKSPNRPCIETISDRTIEPIQKCVQIEPIQKCVQNHISKTMVSVLKRYSKREKIRKSANPKCGLLPPPTLLFLFEQSVLT